MYSSLNEILEVFKDKYYNNVRSFMEKSKSDPPNTPHKSNYAAKTLLQEMKTIMMDRIDHCKDEDNSKEKSMLAAINYLHGCVSMDVEEMSVGEENLNESVDLTKSDPTHADNALTVVSTLNQLGLLWFGRGDYTRALSYLRESEDFYKNNSFLEELTGFEKLLTGEQPTTESGKIALEKLHTLTLYYLAQALGATGDAVNAAAYCHRTLARQLTTPELDSADWALNAATLSQVLVERNAFKEARNHLSAASHVLDVMSSELDKSPSPDSDKHQAELEVLSEREAEVARCWAKYCLNLLTVSRDRLVDEPDQPLPAPDELCCLVFGGEHTGEYESRVSCRYALTWDDAVALFRHGTSWLDRAKAHYTLDSHASDHVAIVSDHSQLYQALAFFNEDLSNQCKMHKKRIDILTSVSDQLNPQYYIDLLRQLWFEIGDTYMTMMYLKIDKPSDNNNYVTKINGLINHAVLAFQKFTHSFDNQKKNEKYEEVYERSVLLAKIHIGKLVMKIKTDDPKLHIEHTAAAIHNYQEVVDYCEKWKSADPLSPPEVMACQEMAKLLHVKLSTLINQNRTLMNYD